MSYYWYHESLKFENDLNKYFSNEDLQDFSTKKISNEKDNELYLQGSKIFIDDNTKIKCSNNIKDAYEYYSNKISKLKNSKTEFFIFEDIKKSFKKIEVSIKYNSIPRKYIEDITVRNINSNILQINPYFFNEMLNIYIEYDKYCNNIRKFRNLQSAIILSDKISFDNNIITLYYHDSDNEEDKFQKNKIDFPNSNVPSLYFYIFDWIGIENDNLEIVNLKYKVAKIYLSKFENMSNNEELKKKEVHHDLSVMYNLILQKKSQKYYEYNKIIRDHKIEIIQQKIELKNELNKKLMSMMVFIPVTIYGFYITVQRNEEPLNIFNNDFNIIYSSSLIALIFVIASLINDVKSMKNDYETIISEIINTYKINKSKDDFGNNISLCDFKFSLSWILVMILALIILILF
ncbi:hypothetical protein [Staphylococcus cohnii]|uniref:Uncharacterized protein n=1 Tax=Staphylococcus cohnii subsp. cohnii TaxID=74704 RepID=A0A0M2P1T5_STACC|nr:hypothetical protein [Staphylococcus cohnii]KKI64774.1 hypothetical protein UF66_2295 [Staphylococcus cohnii subsp. cohnii]